MKRILAIGAGKSTSVLIEYLLEQAREHDWHVHVVDRDEEAAQARVGGHERGSSGAFHAGDDATRKKLVKEADLVVSMLPASTRESIRMHGSSATSGSLVAPSHRRGPIL